MSLKQTLLSLWDPLQALLGSKDSEHPSQALPESALKQLQLQVHRRLGSPYSGEHQGLFKGQGIDLKNLREYQPGDDIRKIDWNVFARLGTPHVKEHYEEKQIPVWFFLDATAPMYFGQVESKISYAQKLIGLLCLLALDQGHRIGLILWQGEKTPQVIQPNRGFPHLQWILHEIDKVCRNEPIFAKDMDFPHLPNWFSNRCLIFFLSDFAFLDTMPQSMETLVQLSRKHEIRTLLLMDPVEKELIYQHGWLALSKTGQDNPTWINTADRWLIKEYRQQFKKQIRKRSQLLSPWSRFYKVNTDYDPLDTLAYLTKAVS